MFSAANLCGISIMKRSFYFRCIATERIPIRVFARLFLAGWTKPRDKVCTLFPDRLVFEVLGDEENTKFLGF